MAKTRRQMIEQLSQIDAVIEVVDARIPLASRNPDFDDLFNTKERILLLNKADLADPQLTQAWVAHYKKQGITAIDTVATAKGSRRAIIERMERATKERAFKRGIRRTVSIMVIGIPNAGKSSIINLLAGAASTKTANRPGVTRGRQVVRIGEWMSLIDTPGVLWPKLEDQEAALHLAYTGSIKDQIMDTYNLAIRFIDELRTAAPNAILQRYKLEQLNDDAQIVLEDICRSRGFRIGAGEWDIDRAVTALFTEFRAGKLGRISLEKPEN